MNLSRFKNWIGLPLAFGVFGVYAIQRGFIALSRTDLVPVWFKEGLDIYFLTTILIAIFAGYLLDKVSTKKAILLGTVLGVLGLITLPWGPWGFGLMFGGCSVLFKLGPFSGPMKIFDGGEAFKIVPQSAAKNLGAALFVFILGSLLVSLGWGVSSWILAVFFGIAGLSAYLIMPEDKIEGWNLGIFKELVKQWQFWLLMLYFFFMAGTAWLVMSKLIPAMIGIGISKSVAISILGTAFLVSGAFRWPAAWLGTNFGHTRIMAIGVLGQILCIPFVQVFPLVITYLYAIFNSLHSPNYWVVYKQQWGKTYVATIGAMAYVSMYLGVGVIYGRW